MPIVQPGGSIKLANVAQVKLKKGKKNYILVCYPNKVQDWRKGVEKDLDEVLQLPSIFVNVKKGQVASSADIKESFGTSDTNQVILELLKKGEMQVGDKERAQQQQETHAKVLSQVVAKTVNPRNQRPYTSGMIEKALSRLAFQYSTTKPVKGQALEAVKLLVEKQLIPIKRAKMRIRISDDAEMAKLYVDELATILEEIEQETREPQLEVIALIDPGDFSKIDEFVAKKSEGGGLVDVMALDY